MYLREFINFVQSSLKSGNLTEAELIVCHILKFQKREELIFNAYQYISHAQLALSKEYVGRRNAGEPISQILGYKEFWDGTFFINSHVLTPRADSETIIELVMKYFPKKDNKFHVLDLGTGSGCLIITLLKIYHNSTGIGVDISDDALNISNYNAVTLKVSDRLALVKSNWFGAINPSAKFDIIVCNPPYIAKKELYEVVDREVRDYEPEVALTDGADGLLHYKALARSLSQYLSDDGIAFFEIGYDQSKAVSSIFYNYDYRILEIGRDLAKIQRVMVVTHGTAH